MLARITPSPLKGTVPAIASKSMAHRLIICAALANGETHVTCNTTCADIEATVRCLTALGARIETVEDGFQVHPTMKSVEFGLLKALAGGTLDCGESGSALRFFIPVAAAGGINATFVGHGKLPERPIGIFTEALPKAGVKCETEGGLPLKISGRLESGTFEIPGNVSSQFITGLLLALPLVEGDSDIVLTSPIESVGYINMTIHTMAQFGVEIETTDNGWHIKGGQSYTPHDYTTDGDWSQAAFFMVAGALGGKVTVNGVNRNSAQGDRKIAELLARFGAKVTQTDTSVTVEKGELNAIDIDASQIPDLVPVLTVCAAFAKGTTGIYNAERLRIKECDRLTATAKLINDLGGKVTELPDGLVIEGIDTLKGGFCEGFNDHRIVMSAGVCAVRLNGEIESSYALSINKSYPDFYIDYNNIGGKANVLDLR